MFLGHPPKTPKPHDDDLVEFFFSGNFWIKFIIKMKRFCQSLIFATMAGFASAIDIKDPPVFSLDDLSMSKARTHCLYRRSMVITYAEKELDRIWKSGTVG